MHHQPEYLIDMGCLNLVIALIRYEVKRDLKNFQAPGGDSGIDPGTNPRANDENEQNTRPQLNVEISTSPRDSGIYEEIKHATKRSRTKDAISMALTIALREEVDGSEALQAKVREERIRF